MEVRIFRGGIPILLQKYLEPTEISLGWLLDRVKLRPYELSEWEVIHYPDELIYELAKILEKKPSQLFYELLSLETPGQIRRTATDYSLRTAIANEAMYLYIPIEYRKEPTKFLTEVLMEKEIYEAEPHPLARFNIIGKLIYEAFQSALPKSDEFHQIEFNLKRYFVLANDKGGTILCHDRFNEPRRL